jgi:hypothetical protein
MQRETRKKAVKFIAGAIAGMSSSRVVYAIVRKNIDDQTGINKIMIPIGTLLIASVVTKHTRQFTNEFVDDIFAAFPATEDTTTQS